MDSDLTSLLNQKKTAIKTLSLSGSNLNFSKGVNINGDLQCSKITCDFIDINPTGNKSSISDSIITNSTIDSTSIGLDIPDNAIFTKIQVLSKINGNLSQAIVSDGDIYISNTDNLTRKILSTNPLTITSNKILTLDASSNIIIKTNDKCNIESHNNINITSNKVFNVNTSSITSTGFLNIYNNNYSYNLNSGSIITQGGVSINKNIIIGENINIHGNLTVFNNNSKSHLNGTLFVKNNISTNGSIIINNNTDSTSINNGSLIIYGGVSIKKNLNIGGNITLSGTYDSTSINNGSLIIPGGVSISKNLNVNKINIHNSEDSTNINNGSLNIKGGISISKNANIGGNTIIYENKDSINSNTGSLVLHGGLGIKKNINTDGIVIINNNTQSSNINSGSLIVKGGVSIHKNTNILGNLNTYSLNVTQNITSDVINIKNSDISLNVTGKSYFHNNIYLYDNTLFLQDINLTGNIYKGDSTYNQTIQSENFNDLTVHDNLILTGNEESTSINTGSFTTQGGVGIEKSLHLGGNLNILGNAIFSNNVNCLKTLYADNIHVRYNITTTSGNIQGGGNTGGLVGEPTIPFDTFKGNLNLSNNMTISNAFQSIDYWITNYFIDTPPILTRTNNPIIEGGEYIEFDWKLPELIHVGFLNQTLPIINSILIDYKLHSQQNWDSFQTVNFNSSLITKIKIYPITSTNKIDNSNSNLYNLYNIQKQTLYDFRVYAINNNSVRDEKYLYFNELQTIPSKLLNPPIDITINPNSIYPNSSIDLQWTHSLSPNLPIYQYNVSYNSLSSIRFGNYIEDSKHIIITSDSELVNAENNLVINNLNPGHNYNINIQSKNILHEQFGQFSYEIKHNINTGEPIDPNYINSNDLYIINNNNYYHNINQGYSLDGNTFVNNIYNYNLLDNSFKTNTINDIRINENISTTQLDSTKLISILNNNSNYIYSNINTHGFTHDVLSNNILNTINLKINNISDFHTNNESGFFRVANSFIEFNNPKKFIIPSPNQYDLQILQNTPYSNKTYKSNHLYFYIDKVDTFTSISNFILEQFTLENIQNISGVPIFISGNLNLSFKTLNLTNHFLRKDKKHFNIFLNNNNYSFSNNLNITSTHFKNSNSDFYYDIDEQLHNTNGNIILPNTSELLFKNISIASSNIQSNYTENININIISYNLHGESLFTSNQKIRFDTPSLLVYNNIQDPDSIFGKHILSSSSEFPLVSELPNSSANYNHSTNLINTSDLQLVNGYFTTPSNTNAFLNYTNYFNNNSEITYYNYTNNQKNIRYVTFVYIDKISFTNNITLEFINTNITNNTSIDDYSVHILIKNSNNDNRTGWLNCNKYISLTGLNNNTKYIHDTGCLKNTTYDTNTLKKKCYLPNSAKGILYIRIGFKSSVDLYLSYVKLHTSFI